MSQPPDPTELVYLPRPTAMPALFAVGLALVIVGLYAWWPISVVGGIVALICLVRWLRMERGEIAAMPNRQHTETGPVPLSGRE